MRIELDPMPEMRKAAVARVNGYFNSLVQPHRDAAHAMKRRVAAVVMGDPARAPVWFIQEAEMRCITATALASLILSKPDLLSQRELQRQRAMAEIDAATTPPALSAVVDKLRYT